MSKAERVTVLASLTCALAGTASAFTWAASGYPAGWLAAWLACWAIAVSICGYGILALLGR